MSSEMVENLKEILPKIIKEDKSQEEHLDWYLKRKKFLEKNDKIMEELEKELQKKYKEEFKNEDFFYMQKLFLMYPEYPPKKLLSLSWENIKILLNIGEEEKRRFYMDLCLGYDLEEQKLKEYILNDIYEKTIFIIQEQKNLDIVRQDNFLDKILEISPMIWN